MTDEILLIFGCGVTFLAVSGAYVLLRGHLLEVTASRSRARPIAEDPAVAPAER
jgi:hypothetical protein